MPATGANDHSARKRKRASTNTNVHPSPNDVRMEYPNTFLMSVESDRWDRPFNGLLDITEGVLHTPFALMDYLTSQQPTTNESAYSILNRAFGRLNVLREYDVTGSSSDPLAYVQNWITRRMAVISTCCNQIWHKLPEIPAPNSVQSWSVRILGPASDLDTLLIINPCDCGQPATCIQEWSGAANNPVVSDVTGSIDVLTTFMSLEEDMFRAESMSMVDINDGNIDIGFKSTQDVCFSVKDTPENRMKLLGARNELSSALNNISAQLKNLVQGLGGAPSNP